MTSWQSKDKSWRSTDDRPDTIHERVAAIVAGLRSLGMLKPGEQPRALHQHGCPAGYPPYPDACRCPGGPELLLPDWDENVPGDRHHQPTPERFYARH